MKERLALLIMTVFATLTVHGQQNSGLSLKVKVDPKRVSKVAPAFIEVVLENKSGSDIALSQSVLRQLAGRWLFGIFCSPDTKVVYAKAYAASDEKEFWVLPAGKYVRLLSRGSYLFSYGWHGEKDTMFEFYVVVVHKDFSKEAQKRYKKFAREREAATFYSTLTSNKYRFLMLGVTNPVQRPILDTLNQVRTRSDNVTPLLEEISSHRREVLAAAPGYPVDDWLFCCRNDYSFPYTVSNLPKDTPFRDRLQTWLEECDRFIHRWQAEMPLACEFLLWRKVAVLYALGREAEAETIKQSIIAKEPNRCFFLELQWLKNTIKGLKENLQTEEEEQQNNSTQPASPQPQQPTPKKESSTTKNHEVTVKQTNLHPEHETETVEKRRVRSERGVGVAERRPPVAQRSGDFWLWLLLIGVIAAVTISVLRRR